MSRDYKFMVYDKGTNTTHIVGEDRHDSLHVIDGVVEYYNLQNGEGSGEDGEYILMQCTGLKDIEQFEEPKDLYTGYIVRMHQFLFDGTEYENEITGVLEYEEELACVCLTKMQQKDIQKHMGYEDDQDGFEGEKVPVCNFHGLHECSWTYLGNIYEHPHLLEAE